MPPLTGVGRYVDRLCRALLQLQPSLRCDFFYPLWIRRGVPDVRRAEVRRSPVAGPSRLFYQNLIFTTPLSRVYPLAMDALFRLLTLGRTYDLYHETNYVPRPFDGPTLVTVYDLSLVLHPETHPRARVVIFERDFARRMPRVDHFLAISESVKAELVNAFGVAPDQVSVTHLGVDSHIFHPPGDSPAREPRAGHDYGEYILFVGSLEPRKNLTTLFQAYARLPAPVRKRYALVLTGPPGWKFAPMWREVRKLGLEHRVFWRGFVGERELAALYREARAFAFPSLYEGFGLPPLEAMASGTPVVCSDIPAVREVVGDAAIELDPFDVEGWARNLEQVVEDDRLRERLSAAGLERARRFSWEDCAVETLRVYRDLAG